MPKNESRIAQERMTGLRTSLALVLYFAFGLSEPATSAKEADINLGPARLRVEPGYRLPEWYVSHRAHLHTRVGTNDFVGETRLFFKAEQWAAQMGASVLTRHIRNLPGPAWWPSAVGPVDEKAKNRNWAEGIYERGSRSNVHVMTYYSHYRDQWFVQQRPGTAALDITGRPMRGEDYCWISFSSPDFVDFTQTRLAELARAGSAGFYFDYTHQPPDGDYSELTQSLFRQATGLEPPTEVTANDPSYLPYLRFKNQTLKRVFGQWRQAVHAANPECVMATSVTYVPMLYDPRFDSELCRYMDVVKCELTIPIRQSGPFRQDKTLFKPDPDVRLATGWSLLRDACDARPPHIWMHMLSREEGLALVGCMAAYGCIANLDVKEDTMPNMMYRDAFALGDKLGEYLAYSRPERWAAVLHSESVRDRNTSELTKCFRNAVLPLVGAFETINRHRAPVGVITDWQVVEGLTGEYRLIIVPNEEGLPAEVTAGLAAFEKKGGTVLRLGADQRFCDKASRDQAQAELWRQIVANVGQPPVVVQGGPAGLHAVSYFPENGDGRMVVMTNEFTWVRGFHRAINWVTPVERNREEYQTLLKTPGVPPPPVEGTRVVLRDGRKPKRATEAVAGKELSVREDHGVFMITVPRFEFSALVHLEY